ncbi:MAG: multiheme c-type cytochrome [Desulfobacterales bacterium]
MMRGPKTQKHPKPVYLIGIFVWLIVLFVFAGVVNHLAFSSRGPGLLIPLMKKFQKKESPEQIALNKHREAEEHQRFHHIVPVPHLPAALQPTCYICHTNLPHEKTKKIRAMLNMHTNYLACETCHLKKKEGETVVYKWYSPEEKHPKGPFFGTAYDPETGELEMVNDHFAKIAPFYEKNGNLTSTVQMQDAPLATDFVKIRDQLTPEQRKDVTKRFHVDTLAKAPDCQTCHSTKGVLDFKALGFSPKRTVDIEELNIVGIITKYDEFYLPDLFKENMQP